MSIKNDYYKYCSLVHQYCVVPKLIKHQSNSNKRDFAEHSDNNSHDSDILDPLRFVKKQRTEAHKPQTTPEDESEDLYVSEDSFWSCNDAMNYHLTGSLQHTSSSKSSTTSNTTTTTTTTTSNQGTHK